MALPEGALHGVRIAIDFGGGARQGTLSLLMPPALAPSGRAGVRGAGQRLGDELRPVVMEGRVQLEAVLCRLRLPLLRIRSMAPGDTLRIPAQALTSLSLETLDRRPVGQARLGQMEGRKAVRLSILPADPAAPVPAPRQLSVLSNGLAPHPQRAGSAQIVSAPDAGLGQDWGSSADPGGTLPDEDGFPAPGFGGLSPSDGPGV
jgi:flagellar motor switch protein FliM